MIRREVLEDLGLEELIGTFFEEKMIIRRYEAGEVITNFDKLKMGACYVYEGTVRVVIYSLEGREFYRYSEEGDIIAIGEDLLEYPDSEMNIYYGADLRVQREFTAVYLPFRAIYDREFPGKVQVLEKLLRILAREKSRILSYCMGRMIYSDEEFIMKALEKRGSFNLSTPDLAKALNMSLRSLQRCLRKLDELQVIKRKGSRISIGDEDKVGVYKENLIR